MRRPISTLLLQLSYIHVYAVYLVSSFVILGFFASMFVAVQGYMVVPRQAAGAQLPLRAVAACDPYFSSKLSN